MVLDILRRPKPQNFLVKRKERIIQKEKKKEIATSVFAPGNITHNHNIFKDIHTYIFLFYESFGLNFIFLFVFHVFCLWPEKRIWAVLNQIRCEFHVTFSTPQTCANVQSKQWILSNTMKLFITSWHTFNILWQQHMQDYVAAATATTGWRL